MARRKSLSSDRNGSAMVEFAMLAPVFFLMIAGLVEFVLYQFKLNSLNHLTYEVTRNLQTGEVQSSGDALEAFLAEACNHTNALVDCDLIDFDVRAYDEMDEIDFPPPEYDEDGRPTNFVFQPGGAYQYSVVRASIQHTFVTPHLGRLFGMSETLPAMLSSFAVVRNEPWN